MVNYVSIFAALTTFLIFKCTLTVYKHFYSNKPPIGKEKVAISLFLGSGGHTSELLQIIDALDFIKFSPRLYLISSGDSLSTTKVRTLENKRSADAMLEWSSAGYYDISYLHRTRTPGQSITSVPLNFFITFFQAIVLAILPPSDISSPSNPSGRNNSVGDLPQPQLGDLLIMNGPATSIPLVCAVWVAKFIGLPHPRMVYIESWTRVDSLSKTGKIVKPFVDTFITQWEGNTEEEIKANWFI